ncbi:hypothetical protein ACFL50_04560 [Candidatus Latescibacterota bacterium]
MPSPLKKSFAAEQLSKRKKKKPILLIVAIIFAIIAVGYALYMNYGSKEIPTQTFAPPSEEIKSIAVLPFVDNSQEKDQEWFCDGLSDAIINALANVGDLKVISRNSTFVFKGEYRDIRAIGDSLDVESVLEGSVLKSGDKIRVTAQLIKVADNSHILSRIFDYEIQDIFSLQDSISLAVVNALRVELQGGEKEAIQKRYTENIEAYNLYMMGIHYSQNWNFREAKNYFLKAIESDPSFALAYSSLAPVSMMMGDENPKEYAEKAIELDNTIPEAYAQLGRIILYREKDWAEGERLIKQALTLDPKSVVALHAYSGYQVMMGEVEEALETCLYILELDPFWTVTLERIIHSYLYLGRYDEAKEFIDKALLLFGPDNDWISNLLSYYYVFKGQTSQAIANDEKRRALNADSEYDYMSARIFALSGNREKVEEIIQKHIDLGNPFRSMRVAVLYLGLRDIEQALKYWERSYEENDFDSMIKWSSCFYEPIRSETRYRALLRKMGLPED